MLAIEGIYQEDKLILKEKVTFTKPVRVIVTFLEDPDKMKQPKIDIAKFSFAQSRKRLKDLKTSLSDTLIEERRDAL